MRRASSTAFSAAIAVARGHGAVEGRLRPDEQARVLAGREPPAARGVAEAPLLLLREPHRLVEPALLARRRVELQEALDEEGVVVEEGGHVGAAVAEDVEERPAGVSTSRESTKPAARSAAAR